MLTETKLISADEFLTSAPPDTRSELVRGEIIVMAPASFEHGNIAGNILALLHNHVRKHKLGKVFAAETGFILTHDPDTVRAPDVAFVSQARLDSHGRRRGFFDGAPDVAVEVASPSESSEDIQDKVIDYLEAGTKLILYIYPRTQTVTVYRSLDDIHVLTVDDTFDAGETLANLRFPIAEIFHV